MAAVSDFVSRQFLEPLLRRTDDNGMKHRKFVVAGWLSVSLPNLLYALGLAAYHESAAARTMMIMCFIYAFWAGGMYFIMRIRKKCELWFVALAWFYILQGITLQSSWFHNKAVHCATVQAVLSSSLVVARPPSWFLIVATLIAVIQVIVFSVGEHYDFGLFTFLPGDQYLEIPTFMSLLAGGLLVFWLLTAVGTVYAVVNMLEHEENKADLTIKVAKAAALGLSLYDIDSVKEMLNHYEDSEDSDVEMKNVIMSICENMEKYKSYLPNWLINTEENDFMFESEEDDDDATQPSPAKTAQLEVASVGGPSPSETPRALTSKSKSKRDLENQRNAILGVLGGSVPEAESTMLSPRRIKKIGLNPNTSSSGTSESMSGGGGVIEGSLSTAAGASVQSNPPNPLAVEVTDVEGSDGMPTPLQRFASRGGITANHFFGKITFASLDFDLASVGQGAAIQVALNHFVETLTDLVSATHGALHSISGDTAQLSWNAVQRVAQPENKALKVVNLLREHERFLASGVQVSGAVSTGDAKCFDAGRKVHSTVVSPVAWKEAHGEMRQIGQKYGTFVCDAATFEQAKYHHELAAVDYVELSSTKPRAVASGGVPAGAKSGTGGRRAQLQATVLYEVVRNAQSATEGALPEKKDSEWMYQLQETENASTASKISKVVDSLIFPSSPTLNSGALQTSNSQQAANASTDTVMEASKRLQSIVNENEKFFHLNPMCRRLVDKVSHLTREDQHPVDSSQPLKQHWLSILTEE